MAITINGNGTVTGISVGGLPDGIVDTDMIASNAVTAAKATGLGISVADQWRQTADFATSSLDPITANWERIDTTAQGTIGTAMSESSGIFTFPSTGIYYVEFKAHYKVAGNTEVRYADLQIQATTNNSSYASIAKKTQGQGHGGTGNNYTGGSASTLVDVTDTSNVKVRFSVSSQASVSWMGNSGRNDTCATFIRLGDT